jgi:hypothetical protein
VGRNKPIDPKTVDETYGAAALSKRLVYVVATGKKRFAEMAMGLGRSLRLIGDANPRAIVTDIDGYDWSRYFDYVCEPTGKRSALDKLKALETSEADQILALDADMLAFQRLDDIFEFCAGKPFAVQGFMRTEGSFHGVAVPELLSKLNVPQFPKFNGGLAYYERTPKFSKLLASMVKAEENYENLGFEWFRGAVSEEVCMAMSMVEHTYFDFISPEKQFQHSAAGLMGRLNLDVFKGECTFVARQERIELCRPYIFHAWRYKDFLVYWRELKKLERIERFEDRHPNMYISQRDRWIRSLHRRILKARGLL